MKQTTIQYPIELVLALLGDKWKFLIICKLRVKTMRFNELLGAIEKISPKVLTQQLRSLEEAKLITRTIYPEIPPRVEYSLTELGTSLEPILESMFDWGMQHQAEFKDLYPIQIDPHLKFPKSKSKS